MADDGRESGSPQHDDTVVLTAKQGACPQCRYELAGCPIVREPHYGLLILRCPECGHVSTPVPQHLADALIARSRRAAFFWWILFAVVMLAPAAALAGLAQSTGYAVSHPYAVAIAKGYHADPAHPPAYHEPSAFCVISEDFATTVDKGFFSQAGGWVAALDWAALTDLLYAPLICVPAAVLWALLLPHLRRQSLLLLAGVVMAVGAAGLTVYYSVPTSIGASEYAYRLAELRVGWQIGAISFVAGAVVFAASIWVARPLARGVTCLAPLSVRTALRPLWLRDGMAVPGDDDQPALVWRLKKQGSRVSFET